MRESKQELGTVLKLGGVSARETVFKDNEKVLIGCSDIDGHDVW